MRHLLRALLSIAVGLFVVTAARSDDQTVEQWDVCEITLAGPADGNPFVDVELSAMFSQGARTVRVGGFYDGEGTYKVRFSPDATGEW